MSYQEYMKVKYQKKLKAREANQEKHKDSIRHEWNPLNEQDLDKIYQARIAELDMGNESCEKILVTSFPDKNKLIKLLREETLLKYSPKKLRMFYHMLASGTDASKINGYKLCMNLLKTWEKIYGRQWEGEPYHIDHIIPLSSARSKAEIRSLNRPSNLCMLYPKHNLSKGARYPHPIYYILKGK